MDKIEQEQIIQELSYNLEKKQVIGITGSPGSGKVH